MENQKTGLTVARKVYLIPVRLIRPFADQPRKHFDDRQITQLSCSIHDFNQQEPIKVRRINEPPYEFEIIDGECRFKAAVRAGQKCVEAIIRDVRDEKEQFALSLLLNFGKQKHSHLEIADAVKKLHDENKMTETQIARMLGQDQYWVSNYYSLSRLIPKVRAMMSHDLPKKKRLPFTSAVKVSKVTPEYQLKVAQVFLERGAKSANQIIRQQSEKMGIRTRSNRTPKADFNVLNNFAKRAEHDLATYRELTQSFFDAMFRHRSEEDPINMAQSIRRIKEGLDLLESKVRTALQNKKAADAVKAKSRNESANRTSNGLSANAGGPPALAAKG